MKTNKVSCNGEVINSQGDYLKPIILERIQRVVLLMWATGQIQGSQACCYNFIRTLKNPQVNI